MHEPSGKRRRESAVGTAGPRVPATSGEVVALWRAVTAAHRVIEHRTYFSQVTPYDERLAGQLKLLSMLQVWQPLTSEEIAELVYVLGVYADAHDEATKQEAAQAGTAYIRSMAVTRTRLGPPEDGWVDH